MAQARVRRLDDGMTNRDVPSHSAGDVDLTDGDAVVIGLYFWWTLGYLVIHFNNFMSCAGCYYELWP